MCVFNFMHGCSNYGLVKTEIDVMMLFKFEVKYVELNFKAIALMEFSLITILSIMFIWWLFIHENH